jgi:hypothetical protein
MKNVSFGIGQLKKEVPAFVGWVVGSSALIMGIVNLAKSKWPTVFTPQFVDTIDGILGVIILSAPLFGVKPPVNTPQDESIK